MTQIRKLTPEYLDELKRVYLTVCGSPVTDLLSHISALEAENVALVCRVKSAEKSSLEHKRKIDANKSVYLNVVEANKEALAKAEQERDQLKAENAELVGHLKHIAHTYCGIEIGKPLEGIDEPETDVSMVAAFVEGVIDEQAHRADKAEQELEMAYREVHKLRAQVSELVLLKQSPLYISGTPHQTVLEWIGPVLKWHKVWSMDCPCSCPACQQGCTELSHLTVIKEKLEKASP